MNNEVSSTYDATDEGYRWLSEELIKDRGESLNPSVQMDMDAGQSERTMKTMGLSKSDWGDILIVVIWLGPMLAGIVLKCITNFAEWTMMLSMIGGFWFIGLAVLGIVVGAMSR